MPGGDWVLTAYLHVVGPDFTTALAACTLRLPSTGAPMVWRGGLMWPAQRRGDAPLSLGNARGMLCGKHMGKLHAALLRQRAMPFIPQFGRAPAWCSQGRRYRHPDVYMQVLLPTSQSGLALAQAASVAICVRFFIVSSPKIAIGPLLCDEDRTCILKRLVSQVVRYASATAS